MRCVAGVEPTGEFVLLVSECAPPVAQGSTPLRGGLHLELRSSCSPAIGVEVVGGERAQRERWCVSDDGSDPHGSPFQRVLGFPTQPNPVDSTVGPSAVAAAMMARWAWGSDR